MITKVAILSGEEPLMNLEVRVGDENGNGKNNAGLERFTVNERCGMFFGPTLVNQQWVEVECGVPKGMKGRFLSLQLTERFMGNNPLEITQLEIYGWGRVCGWADPDLS